MKKYFTYDAITIAYSLLKHAHKQGKTLTNLQVQKLTYVSHGFSLALFDRPLIIEDIMAWKYGPVIPSLYFKFKKHQSYIINEASTLVFDDESESIIETTISLFGDFTGPQLVNLTHRKGSPWSKFWDANFQNIIEDEVIKQHYLNIVETQHADCL